MSTGQAYSASLQSLVAVPPSLPKREPKETPPWPVNTMRTHNPKRSKPTTPLSHVEAQAGRAVKVIAADV
jgi:hypothetical protein